MCVRETSTLQNAIDHVVLYTSAGRFTGIVIYRGVLLAPVQRFHHNGTGYDRIPQDITGY